ncbi:iron chelate uptake ABC transporter family permease subunit [Streptomyces sp. NPDC057236]|uniref:iron chelate uptake ABC transporter family permease subunit n=1 Tax=Streptomyces sp. NPDC057236 TaxID=3346059 RepID=UPI00362FA280
MATVSSTTPSRGSTTVTVAAVRSTTTTSPERSTGAAQTAAGAVCGSLATAAVYLLAWWRGVHGYRLVLVGIGASAVLGAATGFLCVRADIGEAARAASRMIGSLGARDWTDVRVAALGLPALLPVVLVCARWLTTLGTGDDTAAGRRAHRRGRRRLPGVAAARAAPRLPAVRRPRDHNSPARFAVLRVTRSKLMCAPQATSRGDPIPLVVPVSWRPNDRQEVECSRRATASSKPARTTSSTSGTVVNAARTARSAPWPST